MAPETAPAAPPAPSASAAITSEPIAVPAPPPACAHYARSTDITVVHEPGGARRTFSWDGYDARFISLGDHCVAVAWPGTRATVPRAPEVAATIDDGWLRLIENTLARLPKAHAARVMRVVVDDRPTEHGIAPFDRKDASDARDGRTVWLHRRLFTEKNHWAHGNFGSYWSYHVQRDGAVADGRPADHDLFSPVLLHEIGHLVGYTIAKADVAGENVPPCAAMCGDRGDCAKLAPAERERGCISPYCMPFKVSMGTENWAEQYRLFFQSSVTRRILESADAGCLPTLQALANGEPAPWVQGPDGDGYHRSRWASCGDQPCKPY